MWLFEYLQLAHQFLGKGRSESEFVPQFFTDVMTAEAPVEDNPFLNITPDYVNRIFACTSNIDGNKVTVDFDKAGQKRVVDSFLDRT